MFSKQAQLVVNAMVAPGQSSAEQMVDAICNSSQAVQHRGPVGVQATPRNYADYPGLAPPPGMVQPFTDRNWAPEVDSIQPQPPWKPVQWSASAPLDVPARTRANNTTTPPWVTSSNRPGVFAPWWTNSAVDIGGDLSATGGFFDGTIRSRKTKTEGIENSGDTKNGGSVRTRKNVFVGGITVNTGPVTNKSTVTNLGPTIHQTTVTNKGPEFHFGPNNFNTSTWFLGPVHLGNQAHVFHRGDRFQTRSEDVVTDVVLVDGVLRKIKKRILFLGLARQPGSFPILQFTTSGMSFDAENCEIALDEGESPQITFVSAVSVPE